MLEDSFVSNANTHTHTCVHTHTRIPRRGGELCVLHLQYWPVCVERVCVSVCVCVHLHRYGMTALLPDYALLCCCAVRGLGRMSREHLAVAVALQIPTAVIITKVTNSAFRLALHVPGAHASVGRLFQDSHKGKAPYTMPFFPQIAAHAGMHMYCLMDASCG